MNKTEKRLVIGGAILVVILSNIIPVNSLIIMGERDMGVYCYSRKDDTTSFFFENGKGPERLAYFDIKENINNYLKDHDSTILKDTLYRNFKINPFCFWRWKDYFLMKDIYFHISVKKKFTKTQGKKIAIIKFLKMAKQLNTNIRKLIAIAVTCSFGWLVSYLVINFLGKYSIEFIIFCLLLWVL